MKCQVTDFLPEKEILAMLAEEAAELSQAALKLRRVLDGTNPTRITYAQAVKSLHEEIADVTLTMDLVGCVNYDWVNNIRAWKMKRWISHLLAVRGKKDDRENAHRHRG